VKQRQLLTVVFALLLALGLYFLARSRPVDTNRSAANGALAPDFYLPQLTGGQLTLSAYRGKVVLLDFWATWCDPCRDEIPRFVDLQTKYGTQGLQIIGVSMDDGPEPVQEFYRRFNMNYPVVMGNAKTGELYGGILGLPVAFLIGRNGRIYSRHIGATDASIFESEILHLLQNES